MKTTVSTIEELEALYPTAPVLQSLEKETAVVNSAYRALIEAAPFFGIASIGADGMDCSPRGDGPGCVHVLDENTVCFPDRRGNNRLDTLRNIVEDPRVALMFLIPGMEEALRINGKAHISVDADLLSRFEVKGKPPVSVVIVQIDTMYFQCARAIKRAGLWDESSKVERSTLPSAGELVNSVLPDFDHKEYDSALQERQTKTLY